MLASLPPSPCRRRLARTGGVVVATGLSLLLGAAAAFADTLTLPTVRFLGAAADDRAGTSVAPAGDVDGDGHGDVVIGAPGALPNGSGGSGGAAYVVRGPFVPGTSIALGTPGMPGFTIRGSAAAGGESAGYSVAGAGDVNGDGLADVIVGAPAGTPGQEGPQTRAGRAYIVFGSRTPHDVDLANLGSGGIVLQGTSHHFPDVFGWHVAPLGDIDHDGHADVAIAAPGNSGFEHEFTRGRAYVVFGRSRPGTIRVDRPGVSSFRIGFAVPGQLTAVAAAGDWNRDGRTDIAVVDGYAVHGRGAVFVVYGKRRTRPVGLAHLGKDGVMIAGGTLHYRLGGATLAGGSDVDGDGRPDLVLGEPAAYSSALAPPAGAAWLIRGAASRATVDLRTPGTRAWQLARGQRGWTVGAASALGRINGDRLADVVTIANGQPLVLFGSADRHEVPLTTLPAARGFFVNSAATEPPVPATPMSIATNGYATVSTAGDLGGSFHDDLLAGAPFHDEAGLSHSGAASLFLTP